MRTRQKRQASTGVAALVAIEAEAVGTVRKRRHASSEGLDVAPVVPIAAVPAQPLLEDQIQRLQGVNIREGRVGRLKSQDEPGKPFELQLQFSGPVEDYLDSDIDINRYASTPLP